MYIQSSPVEYEWDPEKARQNREKHGVAFADAVFALEDELAVTVTDRFPEFEERFVTVGTDALGRVLVSAGSMRMANAEGIRLLKG